MPRRHLPTLRTQPGPTQPKSALLPASFAMETQRSRINQKAPHLLRLCCRVPALQAWRAALTSSCSCWPHPPSHASCWEVRQAIVPELEATQLPAQQKNLNALLPVPLHHWLKLAIARSTLRLSQPASQRLNSLPCLFHCPRSPHQPADSELEPLEPPAAPAAAQAQRGGSVQRRQPAE